MGSSIPVQRVTRITGEQAGYIATTAAEGGIGYWSVIDAYEFERWMPDPFDTPLDVDPDFVFYTIVDLVEVDEGDDTRDYIPFEVTPLAIARGIQRALNAGYLTESIDDIEACDADAADTIIQFAVFGNVVFG